ncbi:hypothetical protein M3Y94_00108200 [Aphelenchoides besseyi]|nr:hypothetical protein M3Y94_00108200 [Aphelenchoides besseyi]
MKEMQLEDDVQVGGAKKIQKKKSIDTKTVPTVLLYICLAIYFIHISKILFEIYCDSTKTINEKKDLRCVGARLLQALEQFNDSDTQEFSLSEMEQGCRICRHNSEYKPIRGSEMFEDDLLTSKRLEVYFDKLKQRCSTYPQIEDDESGLSSFNWYFLIMTFITLYSYFIVTITRALYFK